MDNLLNTAVAALEEGMARQNIPTMAEIDLYINDVWNITERVQNLQNYYFVGSRGSGKTTIISKAKLAIQSGNDSKAQKLLPCSISCSALISDENGEFDKLSLFLFNLFSTLVQEIDPYLKDDYEKIRKISAIASFVIKLTNKKNWNKVLDGLIASNAQENGENHNQLLTSRNRLKLLTDIGSIRVSLFQAGVLSIGNLSFTPIELSFEHTQEKSQSTEVQTTKQIDESDKEFTKKINIIVRKFARECQKGNVNRVHIFVDDLQFLTLPMQIKVIDNLRLLAKKMEGNDIQFVLKLFSAVDLSRDILDSLNLSEGELQAKNIESSLESIDARKRSLEGLLIRILQVGKSIPEDEVQKWFPNTIIEQILILSGGHPRRFLKIASFFLERQLLNSGGTTFDILMESAAEALNDSRNNLISQLGIGADPIAIKYSEWYRETVSSLVNTYINNDQSLFILVPKETTRKDTTLEQWIKDAIAIGDLIEIGETSWIDGKAFWLLALNPATVQGLTGSCKNPINYQDVVKIQLGIRTANSQRALHLNE